MSGASETRPGFTPITWRRAGLLAITAMVCFHAAYTPSHSGPLALLIVGYVACLVQLARLKTARQSFYAGLAVGFACFAPQLECFWRIFGAGAIALWLVLALWIGFFVGLAHLALARLGWKWGALLIPFLWTGLEYFRSELYYLKFSWLNVGYALSGWPFIPFGWLGMYGIGFAAVVMVLVLPHLALIQIRDPILKLLTVVLLLWLFGKFFFPVGSFRVTFANFIVAGVQLEFPDEKQIEQSLDKTLSVPASLPFPRLPDLTNAGLVVIPEYTLDGPPSERLKEWCRTNQKFLIVGGKDPAPGNNYYNTAFVISTNGEIVFKQVKRVPIQFFKDGLPAPEQKVWESPWGKIGICICYDLCYTRVTDELVRQGARMLIVPTMDVADWGRHQHELHARVAPVRAAEYGIPIFRVASSGISQGVNWRGGVQASAPFEGEGEMLFFGARLAPGLKGYLPVDRWLAPSCVAVTGFFVAWLATCGWRRNRIERNNGIHE